MATPLFDWQTVALDRQYKCIDGQWFLPNGDPRSAGWVRAYCSPPPEAVDDELVPVAGAA